MKKSKMKISNKNNKKKSKRKRKKKKKKTIKSKSKDKDMNKKNYKKETGWIQTVFHLALNTKNLLLLPLWMVLQKYVIPVV